MIERVMIHVEVSGGRINPVCLELLSKTNALFTGEDVKVAFSVAGSQLDDIIADLSSSGADLVYAMDDPRLKEFNLDYACAALSESVTAFDPDLLLIGATMFGEELAPTMGLKLDTGVAAHCMDITRSKDGGLAHMVPAFGGKVVGEIFIPDCRPQISSVKPGIFKIEALPPKDAEVKQLDPSILDHVKTRIHILDVHHKEASCGVPLDKADVVICGGYGMADKENWANMEALATRLNGAIGCTRPAVDSGFTEDESIMIGTSGKSVRPKVYIGFGISGAMHHLCGIKDSTMIIAVNSDSNADIFKSSDYYAVADARKVIEKMLEKLK